MVRNNEEFLKEKERKLEIQRKNIDIIKLSSKYLNDRLCVDKGPGEAIKVTMRDVLNYIENNGYSIDDTKAVSQINYLILDLFNAQSNPKFYSGDRINIRILYIQERLKSTFKKELHNDISTMMKNYSFLYYWHIDGDTKNYELIN